MCNQIINFSLLMTKAGLLRICFHTLTLLGVGLNGAGLDKSLWGRAGNHCPQSSCPALRLVEWGLAIIILSWLFGLGMLVAIVSPKHNKTKLFSFANTFGYPTFGFFLMGSFVLIIAYLIQVVVFVPCNFFSKGCEDIRDNKWIFFQPGFMVSGAIVTLIAGILGIYISKDKKDHQRSTISTTDMSGNQTTVRQNSFVSI